MDFAEIRRKVIDADLYRRQGKIEKIIGMTVEATGPECNIGDVCRIFRKGSEEFIYGEVVGFNEGKIMLMPYTDIEGIGPGSIVDNTGRQLEVNVGNGLIGRIINAIGQPLDGKGPVETTDKYSIVGEPVNPLTRPRIEDIIPFGVKAIDGLLTIGRGQRMGIFAGSGVGKSTLMGMIVKHCVAPIKVVALIGERGREVPEFIQKNLGGDLSGTVMVVATSDDSSLMRKYGAFCAMSVAEYFKNKGKDVLFIMDSVTRFAMAQREIGLALGEPPTSKGYPPSSLTLLPQLMERAGKEESQGSITAFFTVLVEGDDMSDPIADQSRSILDGHIVLDRSLTDYGIYPPINILNSASRVMGDVTTPEHRANARKFKRYYSMLKENEVLIRIGAYQKGSDKELDMAIAKKAFMDDFIRQDATAGYAIADTVKILEQIN